MSAKAIYRCPRCGSTSVQGTAWIHLNSGKEVAGDPPDDDIWCPRCEEHFVTVCIYGPRGCTQHRGEAEMPCQKKAKK